MMLYRDTGNEQDLDWFFKTLDYCQKHFSDPAYGEWYGYLRRDGLPTMPSTKGSTFKGPVPSAALPHSARPDDDRARGARMNRKEAV